LRRPTSVRTRGGLLSLVLAAAVVVSGCGISTAGPKVVPRSQVPFGLLDPHSPTTTTTVPSKAAAQVLVYFVNSTSTNLIAEPRYLPVPGPSLDAVLNALVAGPSTSEIVNGVQTSIGSQVRVLGTSTSNGVATVNFNSAFGLITTPQTLKLAAAQVVFTVVHLLGPFVGVLFEIDGAAIGVPDETGASISGPVYLSQYASLAPQSSSATTPTTSAPT
jgi:spore germination protein GerM